MSDLDVRRFGVALQRADAEVWSFGALEARCRCSDTEVSRSTALETRCRCSDYGGMEL